MAEHAFAADRQLNNSPPAALPLPGEADISPAKREERPPDGQHSDADADGGAAQTRGRRSVAPLLALSAAVVVALGCLAGWLGYRTYEARQAQAQTNEFVAVARQAALNLTSIDYTDVDGDIQRILNLSTGTFHDDFQQRSQPFIDVVRKTQSKSEGTITAAGVQSQDGDQAEVLVAVTVNTTNAAAPKQDPRSWRMRISVEKSGDNAKVSNVQFVP